MLAFIGFIALLIFGKFLYDTYVTGKTDKDWDSFKKHEPEKAARIMNNPVTNMSTDYKYNPLHQKESLQVLATVFECEVSEVAETYKAIQRQALVSGLGTVEQFKQAMKELRQEKYKQAVKMKFDPDNTPAAFMERWMQEVIDEPKEPQISIKDLLLKATSLASRKQHFEANQLIEKADEMIESGDLGHEDHLKPYFFNTIGKYYLETNQFDRASAFFGQAIDELQKTNPSHKETLKMFISSKESADDKSEELKKAVANAMMKVQGSFAKAAQKQLDAKQLPEPSANSVAEAIHKSEDIAQSDKAESKSSKVYLPPPIFGMVKNNHQNGPLEVEEEEEPII